MPLKQALMLDTNYEQNNTFSVLGGNLNAIITWSSRESLTFSLSHPRAEIYISLHSVIY